MTDAHKKLPRLYVDAPLNALGNIIFPEAQAHYLKNVLRREAGMAVRLFNGRDGEWLCLLTQVDKKSVTARCDELLHPQGPAPAPLHLIFAPIKKARLDMLIEKAVELGATHLYPVITQNTENRSMSQDRVAAQIVEAAEQCERLDIPTLFPALTLDRFLSEWNGAAPIAAALERCDAALPLQNITDAAAILIGPEGGFTEKERDLLLRTPFIRPASLGPRILRAETAAFYALSLMAAHK